MKRFLMILLVVLIAAAGCWAFKRLPSDESELIREKYAGWTGVLRVWLLDDWEIGDGSLERFLTACAVGYEKTAPGVRVSVRAVSASALASYAESGVNPPDIVVYPSGFFVNDAGFIDVNVNAELRRGLWDGARAVPIAISACAWAWDAARFDGNISAARIACPESILAALICLRSGERDPELNSTPGGIDIGLETTATARDMDIHATDGGDMFMDDSAAKLMRNGDIDAAVADMRDLPALARDGCRVAVTGDACYVGEAAYMSIVAKDAPSQAACVDFLNYALGEGARHIARAGALSAAENAFGWQGEYLAGFETQLSGMRFIAPEPFSSDWRRRDFAAAGGFISGEITADAALQTLR